MSWLQNKFEKNFMITTVDYVFNWARKSALWPMTFGSVSYTHLTLPTTPYV